MPHHAPGEAGPRPHSLSASRSRAARAALVYLGRRKGTGSAVSPCGQSAVLHGLLWVTRCHLCHPAADRPALAHRPLADRLPPHWIPAPALDPADREGRAHRRDAGEAGEAIAVDAVVLFKIVRGDAQQVIGRAAHQVAIEDIGHVLHRGLEPVHRLAALAGQRDLDEGLQFEPQFVRIDLRGIAGDDPRRFQRLDPAVAGRGGDPGEIGQIGDRARRVFLERFEDQHVVAVHGKSFRPARRLREISPRGRQVKANFGETFVSDRRIFGRHHAGEP